MSFPNEAAPDDVGLRVRPVRPVRWVPVGPGAQNSTLGEDIPWPGELRASADGSPVEIFGSLPSGLLFLRLLV